MRSSLITLLLAFMVVAVTAQAAEPQKASSADAAAGKPNIVFILMDNLGYGEVGCYGGGITRGAATPRIDQLAMEGTRLLNFNVESQCTPSRSAILTGRFSIRSGTHSVPIGGGLEGLTQWEVTIAELLSGAGYSTAHFGKWHLGSEQARLPNAHHFPVLPFDRFQAVRHENGKTFYDERDWWTPPTKLGSPKAFDLITDPKEEFPATGLRNSWIAAPAMKIAVDFEQSLKKRPPIAPGTADPYTPPK